MEIKLYKVIIGSAAAASVMACSKELPQHSSLQNIQDNQVYAFEAMLSDNQTRTTIHDETTVYWSERDSITVFYGSAACGKFVGNNQNPCAQTTFRGTFDSFSGSIDIGTENTCFWGLYPYSSTATCSGDAVTVEVPACQTAMEGTFAPDLFPAVAKSYGLSLAFYNVCGGVMFIVSQKGIKSVTLKGENDEYIAGTANVDVDNNGIPKINSFIDGETEITVTAPDSGSFTPGVKYYLVAFPAALSNGCSITYRKISSFGTYNLSSALEIKRSVFGVVNNADNKLTFNTIEGNITFADEVARQACVDMFDTNEDGEVSYAEAYAATSLKNLFKNYSGVTSFEEIKFFVNVTDLNGAFSGCTQLKTVTIPENITAIGSNSFLGCTSLEALTIPKTVTSLGENAFYGCSSLNDITIPSSVTSIGSQCFGEETNTVYMTGVTPPSISEDSFVAGTVFYVPFSALDEYKNHENWSIHEANIKAVMSGANCFVISDYSEYFFEATMKGNSTQSVGKAESVEVLWESFGTATAPEVGDIVSNVSYKDGKVFFTASGKDGNAVIAVKDAAGNILWSWHIWVCKDFDPSATAQAYKNEAGTMMDRNLGALSATPGDLGSLGLLYQWGRKDPFLGNESITSESPYGTSAASTISWPRATSSDASSGNISYTIANPTKFITCNDANNDWYYTGSTDTDNTRWQTSDQEKTMYDPCPAGWRVPDGGDDSIWSKAFGISSEFSKGPWNSTNRGMDFGSGNGKESSMQLGPAETIWYPATGCRSYSVGGVKYPGSNGYYWTCSSEGSPAYSFFFDPTGKVIISSGRERAAGRSVRCCKEQ